ncbi:FAD-dependent oxidoreductase [Brevibacillus invocatus]|uniref:FAD-dependent oxidoreductase n=1 Tax=Brevibacillus invocatus TaxID=173959 RepID=UPI00204176FD|nr:FAD-dependent oxidoreductase [Brevibacillus invocatus]MCM3432280.1 FAD-dependent oxidoreductase [Brevibacillus invocatus]
MPIGGIAATHEGLYPLPFTFSGLLRTRLLTWNSKVKYIQLMLMLQRMDAESFHGLSWSDWVGKQFPHDRMAQDLMLTLGRLWMYADCPEQLDAGATIQQGQVSMGGVYYLHQGWKSLVHSLKKRAESEGVRIVRGKADSILVDEQRVEGILLSNGEMLHGSTVIAALSPGEAAGLVREVDGPKSPTLKYWQEQAVPSFASCLDIVVTHLPEPNRSFALHVQRPLYYSNHSSISKLNTNGDQVIHMLKYQASPEQIDPPRDRRELEEWIDSLQPGWRKAVVTERFLPKMTVTHSLPLCGAARRPAPDETGVDGLYISGDWVGQHGMLADAAIASGKHAAHCAIRYLRNHVREDVRKNNELRSILSLEFASVNGFPGIVIFTGDVPFCTLSFHFEHGTIAAIYNTMNPDKLQHLHRK